jgi:hypothetical protein
MRDRVNISAVTIAESGSRMLNLPKNSQIGVKTPTGYYPSLVAPFGQAE